MRSKKHKSQVHVEYKSTTWKTEIKGDLNNPVVRKLIVLDFILRWVVRPILLLLTALKIIWQYLP
jgi:hypothetical protein